MMIFEYYIFEILQFLNFQYKSFYTNVLVQSFALNSVRIDQGNISTIYIYFFWKTIIANFELNIRLLESKSLEIF